MTAQVQAFEADITLEYMREAYKRLFFNIHKTLKNNRKQLNTISKID